MLIIASAIYLVNYNSGTTNENFGNDIKEQYIALLKRPMQLNSINLFFISLLTKSVSQILTAKRNN